VLIVVKADIVVLIASPRVNGNCATAALAVAKECEAKGKKVETVYLNRIENLRGCQSCFGCKKACRCVIKDATLPILDDIRDAEAIVLSSPTYFGEESGQMKLLLDRFFGFLTSEFHSNLVAGKKAVVITSCGTGHDGAVRVADKMAQICAMSGIETVGKIVIDDPQMGGKAVDAKLLAEAKKLADKL